MAAAAAAGLVAAAVYLLVRRRRSGGGPQGGGGGGENKYKWHSHKEIVAHAMASPHGHLEPVDGDGPPPLVTGMAGSPSPTVRVPADPTVTADNLPQWLTVIMSTSPVISHPSTALIEETAASIR